MAATLARWLLGLAAFAVSVTVWVWTRPDGPAHDADDEPAERPTPPPPDGDEPSAETTGRVTHSAEGEVRLALTAEEVANLGLEFASPAPADWEAQVVLYGSTAPDPDDLIWVRAPVSGTLKSESWPRLGDPVKDTLGRIEPRWAPTPLDTEDRLQRLREAETAVKVEQQGLDAAVAAHRRVAKLNREGKAASDRSVEEAAAVVAASRTRLAAARETVQRLGRALPTDGAGVPPATLTAPSAGVVQEVLAHPDEHVEAGSPLLRLGTGRLLALVTTLPGSAGLTPGQSARVCALDTETECTNGVLVNVSPSPETPSPGARWLVRLTAGGPLAPGRLVRATASIGTAAVHGVVVPRDAVVRHAGAGWVYAVTAEGHYARRKLALDRPVPAGWFTETSPGSVVVVGAESLLSEELLSQFQAAEPD